MWEHFGTNNPATTYKTSSFLDFAGDPVNSATGNLTDSATDLVVPGRGRFLNLSRTYNALGADSEGPFGYGWFGSYSMGLSIVSPYFTVYQENGATANFTLKGSSYVAASEVTATLVKNSNGTYTFTLKDQRSDTFNAKGELISETDRNGYVTQISYNAAGNIAKVIDPAGRALKFDTNSSGLITSVTDPMGRVVTYDYDSKGNLISVVDVAGGKTTYTYDSDHRLLTKTDPRGGVTRNVYDSLSRITSQTDPLGRVTTLSYPTGDSGPFAPQIVRCALRIPRRGHSFRELLPSSRSSGALPVTAAWVRSVPSLGLSLSPDTSSSGTTVTDPDSNVTFRTYNGDYLVTSFVNGSGTSSAATWTYGYDANQNRTSTTDGNGHEWTAVYDGKGNPLTVTDPLGRVTTTVYNSFNDPTSITDPLGVTTTYTYNAEGDLISISRPLQGTSQAATRTFTYGDPSHPGDITAYTDEDGNTTTYAYDTYGDRTSVTDPLGNKWTGAYNEIGFLTSSVSPRGNALGGAPKSFTSNYTYNAFGDRLKATDPLGHSVKYTYDESRNLLSYTDQNGHKTTHAYDKDNEQTEIARANGSTLKSTYDGVGNVTAQIDGLGHATKYAYNALNQLEAITDALGRETSFAYDLGANLISKTNPAGETAAYTYDDANELTAIDYSDGVTPGVTFAYDADGERISMADGSGTSSYVYDSLHRLTDFTSGGGQKVSYAYDLRGLAITITYPNSENVTRSFDASGRLVSVTDWLGKETSFTYDPDGDLIGQSYPNTWTGAFQFNDAGQLTNLSYKSGSANLNFAYGRDAMGQVTTEAITSTAATSTIGLTGTSKNQYDSIERLLAAVGTSYTYDAADHLTALSRGSSALTYDKADELTKMIVSGKTRTYTYDPQGNRTSETLASGSQAALVYDQENRLAAFGTAAEYAYDGDGMRVLKTISGVPQAFMWDRSSGIPLLLQDGSGYYIYGPGGRPLEQITGTTALFYHHDQLGSTQMLTDASGVIAATYTYDAFGNVLTSAGTASNPFLYAGEFNDAESGLVYLRARYYDAATAQSLSRDPLFSSTREAYAYAGENPKNFVDPTGLCASSLSNKFVAASNYVGEHLSIGIQGTANALSSAGHALLNLPGNLKNAVFNGINNAASYLNSGTGAVDTTTSPQVESNIANNQVAHQQLYGSQTAQYNSDQTQQIQQNSNGMTGLAVSLFTTPLPPVPSQVITAATNPEQ